MDLLSLYHSDSDDGPNQQEYSNEIYSETSKPEECLNADYFNLDYSSSDNDTENSEACMDKIRTLSFILSDQSYEPQRHISNTLSQHNFKQNGAETLHSSNSSGASTYGMGSISASDSENAFNNRKVSNTDTVKYIENSDTKSGTDTIPIGSFHDKSAVPNKKQKTDHNKSVSLSSGDSNCVNFSSSCTKCSKQENSVISTERKAFSRSGKSEDYNEKSLPRGLPKTQIKTFSGHSAAVTALRWGINMYSHLLLSASVDSSLKIWDIMKMKTVQDIRISSSRIKSAQWMPCGTALICGGFDKSVHVVDISSGKEVTTFQFPSYVYSIEMHPVSQHLFVAGIKDAVFAFDTRSNLYEPIRKYESRCGQVLDVKFLKEDGSEFVCSTEIVSGDSSDRTIMAWDFASGAQLSNQIFHERFTCPFLKVDPSYRSFVAQTNGNYIAVFSAQRPYKMDKNKRYESHKVLGYPIGLDFNASGKFLASGDAEGGLYFYWSHSSNLIKRQAVKPGVPTTQVIWHPSLHTTMATASWDGDVKLWQ